MKRVISGLVGLAAGVLVLSGCSAPPADGPTPAPSSVPAPAERPTATTQPEPAASASPSGDPTDSPKAGKATGPVTDAPFEVNGIPVVSKDHRLSASYVPEWADRAHGLHPDVAAAFEELRAAARAEGFSLTIRSGYRSHGTQADSFARALRQYPEKTARLYFAEPGASEHQTGLALDAWDGKNRGAAFARTPHARWLAEHAHEHGFIVRYPQGKTHITGYAWESWHLRWVGREVAAAFGPNSTLTLEEYLGLA